MKNITLVVGSSAYNISGRVVKDVDMIGTFDSIMNTFKKIVSVHGKESQYAESDSVVVLKTMSGLTFEGNIAWSGTSNSDIINWVGVGYSNFKINTNMHSVDFKHTMAPTILCWLLKESHKYKDSVHFEKTRSDVLAYRKLYDVSKTFCSNIKLNEILAKREAETYLRPAIKLNVGKDEFFANDGIDYTICPHDTIHELIALGTRPAYLRIQRKSSDVQCEQSLWNCSSMEIKLNCVIEEARVIAIERGILPFSKTYVTDEIALQLFKTALQKICTTLCSGWFREFAWKNYDLIIQQHLEYEAVQNTNFIDIFHIDWKSK